MIELILTAVIYLAGAITEYESRGAVTKGINYVDVNASHYECKEIKSNAE